MQQQQVMAEQKRLWLNHTLPSLRFDSPPERSRCCRNLPRYPGTCRQHFPFSILTQTPPRASQKLPGGESLLRVPIEKKEGPRW